VSMYIVETMLRSDLRESQINSTQRRMRNFATEPFVSATDALLNRRPRPRLQDFRCGGDHPVYGTEQPRLTDVSPY